MKSEVTMKARIIVYTMLLCAMAAQGVIDVKDGKFTLVKPDAYSAAFLVTFEL